MIGKTFAFLALLVAAVAMGYTAWETQNLRVSLDRMAVGNETKITEMMISLAHTESQLARIRETVELLGGSDDGTASASAAAALEGKITATLTAAQREVFQQELGKWAKQLEDRRETGLAALRKGLEQKLNSGAAKAEEGDKRWAELKGLVERNQKSVTAQLKKLGDGLAKPSGAQEQGAALTNLEKRLGAVLKAAENNQKALTQRNERDDKRWKDVFLALEENREALQQRYAELAARLDKGQGGGQQPANPPRTGPQDQAPGGQDTQSERERLLAFCAEVPQSALCRDL